MARSVVANAYEDPAARRVVRAYLRDVGGRLTARGKLRRDILDELEDGLFEAIKDHVTMGMAPGRAASKAIADFGDPDIIARAFARDAIEVRSRRIALTLIRTGPLIGALWFGAVVANDLAPPSWDGPWVTLPVVALALAVGLPAAITTVAATGRLGLRFPKLQGRAPLAAAMASTAMLVADLTVLGMATAFLVNASEPVAWAPLVIVAISASVVRVILAFRAASASMRARAVQVGPWPADTSRPRP